MPHCFHHYQHILCNKQEFQACCRDYYLYPMRSTCSYNTQIMSYIQIFLITENCIAGELTYHMTYALLVEYFLQICSDLIHGWSSNFQFMFVPSSEMCLKVHSYSAANGLHCCTAPYCTKLALLLHCDDLQQKVVNKLVAQLNCSIA